MNKLLNTVILFSSFCSFTTFAGGLEEQRKYVFAKDNQSIKSLIQSGNLDGMSVKGHSTYTYFDIYLDTEDFSLFNNNLSLRIRKRFFAEGVVEYGMQLKSEMTKNGDARMEVEEDELNFHRIYDSNTIHNLKDIVSEMFTYFEYEMNGKLNSHFNEDSFLQERSRLINVWAKFKMKSAIAPFQKLVRSGITLDKLKTLRPVLIGVSKRSRSHIFIDMNNTSDQFALFLPSQRSQLETPDLVKGRQLIWTMESSLDNAKFYSLFSSKEYYQINEYEVENKYLPHEQSRKLLDTFEKGLISEHGGKVNLDSKYRQSMKYFID